MKIAFTSRGRNLEVLLDSRFGRAPFFVIYDTVSGETTAVENIQNLNAAQGAGIQSAATVANAGVEAVVTGHCGPKAFRVLQTAGIKVYQTGALTGAEALRQLEAGALKQLETADVEGHWA